MRLTAVWLSPVAAAIERVDHRLVVSTERAHSAAEADFRMSLARRSSRTSPRRAFSSSRSALLSSSSRLPASASAWRTHLRRVSW